MLFSKQLIDLFLTQIRLFAHANLINILHKKAF